MNFSNLDAPYNKQYYKEGNIDTELAVMGCVTANSVVTYSINNKLYVEGIGRMYKRVSELNLPQVQGMSRYIDTTNLNIKIWDSNIKGFTGLKKIIRNPDRGNWYRITLTGGRIITATDDHPLPVKDKGRTFVKDIVLGDNIPITYSQYKPENTVKPKYNAWLIGALLMCSTYDNGKLTITIRNNQIEEFKKYLKGTEIIKIDKKSYLKNTDEIYEIKDSELREYLISDKMFNGLKKSQLHIPNEVFSYSNADKIKFIAGIMDMRGCIDNRNTGSLTSDNLELIEQFICLIQSMDLEMYGKVYTDKNKYTCKFNIHKFIVNKMTNTSKTNKFKEQKKLYTQDYGKVTKIEKIDVLDYSYDVETQSDRFDVNGINSHNCRTRVIGNVYDPTREIVTGRGNLSFTSINLPRLALKATSGKVSTGTPEEISKFYSLLDNALELVHKQLKDRYQLQCKKHPRNYPFLMGQGIWLDSELLELGDDISEVLRHGTLSVGFIGLAETLKCLTGYHHGESEKSQALGLEIIKHMRDKTDKWSDKERMNYGILATPVNVGTCGYETA